MFTPLITRQAAPTRLWREMLASITVLLAVLTIAPVASADGWKLQGTPNAPGWPQSALSGVSCPYRTSCVAVGQGSLADGSAGEAISEGWNGAGWNVVFGPSFAATTRLIGVVCLVDGVRRSASEPSGGTILALAAGWNGSNWTFQGVNPPSGAREVQLNGVSCLLASQCFAVGSYVDSGGSQRPLFESWDGSSWQEQPGFEARNAGLNAVSCPSGNACLAVGQSAGAGVESPFAER